MRDKWTKAINDAGLDVIIHPALPTPALPHGISGDFTGAFSYTFIANMLLWPAGVVPVTTVRENEQHYRYEDIPSNQRDKMADLAATVMRGSKGLPINVAIMAPAFCDETCLKAMREVQKIAKFEEEPKAYKNIAN